ncbi:MAG: alkaline phosphatase family protein [Prolixibacteraceae bacterium]|nr:alkaline phosphatase family protein [Prolixibacteraceae bacterium]
MKHRLLINFWGLLLIISGIPLSAQQLYYGNKKPKLVIGIVVENMRPDYVDRYWDKFQEDGFKKLYSEGAVCTNFKIEQHIQSYATGTATLFTGVYPASHGIISPTWYDRVSSKEVSCVEDNYYFTVGADTKSGNVSANKLTANTISDNLKVFTKGKSKVFSVALNTPTAVFSAGHAADGAYWFDEESGRMISSSYYVNTFPDWVRVFNSNNYADIYAHRNWTTLLPLITYEGKAEDDYIFEKGYFGEFNTFPHAIYKYVNRMGNFRPLKTTPWGNQLVYDFFVELLDNEDIGKDETTDFVSVAFSSMDYEYGSFGPESIEMEDTYLRLDQNIAALLKQIETRFNMEDVLIFLTANTSASYPVEYLKEEFNLAVGQFSPEGAFALLTSLLNLTYGENTWIENVSGQQVYFDQKLIEKNNINKEQIIETAATFINQFEGVKITLPAHDLERGASGPNIQAYIYNSYNKKRSGDFLYSLEEGWQPTYKFERVNYTDQTHIPLVFYGNGVKKQVIKERYDAPDLVPTLAELISIPPPDRSSGKIIKGIH